jgi:hypothetical protein
MAGLGGAGAALYHTGIESVWQCNFSKLGRKVV